MTATLPEIEHTLPDDPEVPFYEDYLKRRRELEQAGKFLYNDDFRGCFDPPVPETVPGLRISRNGPSAEDMVIYYCQCRYRALALKAKMEALLADGYEHLTHLDGVERFRHVVLIPARHFGGELAEFEGARLVPETYEAQAEVTGRIASVLPKGKRTHGYLVSGRTVLVKR